MSELMDGDYQRRLQSEQDTLLNYEVDYANLCQIAQDITTEIGSDESFARFKGELGKIINGLGNIKSAVSKSLSAYQELVTEFTDHFNLSIAPKAGESESDTVKTLKHQIQSAEDMFQASSRREAVARSEARQIKMDISSLNATMKQGVGLSQAQERTINDLIATKEKTTKELEQELERIIRLRNDLVNISEKIDKTESEKLAIDKEILSLKEKNTIKKIEIDNELRNKDRLEQDLREQRVIVTIKSQEVAGKQDCVNRANEEISVIEGQIRQQKLMIEKIYRYKDSIEEKSAKIQEAFDADLAETSRLNQENAVSKSVLKVKEDELLNHKTEVKKVIKMKDMLIKKNRQMEDQKLHADSARKAAREEYDALLLELENKKKNIESHKKVIEDLTREKDIMKSNLNKASNECVKLSSVLYVQKQQKTNMDLEVTRIEREMHNQTTALHYNQKRKDIQSTEIQKVLELIANMNTELKQKDLAIFEYKKVIMSSDTKLKHLQNMHEVVQSDRNLYSKQLIESQTEIADMKRQLKIMNFQINGYKDELSLKNNSWTKETNEKQKLMKEIANIETELKNVETQNQVAQSYIRNQISEETKLDQFFKEAELEKCRQQNALTLLTSEKENLNAQLVKKNDELSQVYDQIKTQKASLLRRESYYNEKLKTISDLKQQINDKRKLFKEYMSETSELPALKHNVSNLEFQLLQEQIRIKALEEELKNPINVHRWRKLEGSKPQTFELLQMLHSLQKRLNDKTREEIEKQTAIEVKEKLYQGLREVLSKQVGPEIQEQAQEYEKSLKEKKLQLRYMETELNMYQSQVREHKYSISKLNNGLHIMKKKFLELYKQRIANPAPLIENEQDKESDKASQSESAIESERNEFDTESSPDLAETKQD
jgi:chromosome segregation ATPase